jgi:tetratricopeptide (TPR) repeat protein
MGQKSRQKALARGSIKPSPGLPATRAQRNAQISRKRLWTLRAMIALVFPAVILCLTESVLRVSRYGYPTTFFVETENGRSVGTNPKFTWQYYPRTTATTPAPLRFNRAKAPGVKRIFILGESAAAGTPDPAFGFSRMLDLSLREQFPGSRFEILNVAMRGIDSHIIRRIALESAQLSPDLFIVYMGNNEAIGLHAPSPGEFTINSNIRWVRFKESLQRLKLAQLGKSLVARFARKTGSKQDQAFFRQKRIAFDDPRRERIYVHYEINLRDICRAAEDAGAQTLVCSVAVNLRDFPPLGSLHRADLASDDLARWENIYAEGVAAESAGKFQLALERYRKALNLDDHFADLHFRMARCFDADSNIDDARRCYSLARDWDATQFRTDSRLNGIARHVASTSGPAVHFLDIEKHCASSPLSGNGRLFQEHVHFTFEGDHVVAGALAQHIASIFKLPAPAKPHLSRDECARRLAYTEVDEFNIRSSVVRLTSNPPFLDQIEHATRQARLEGELKVQAQNASPTIFDRALLVYQEATAARPEDWMLRYNFGNLLRQLGRHSAAAEQFAQVVRQLPDHRAFRVALGEALLASGKRQEAAAQFEAALELDPDLQPAKIGLQAARR